VLCQKIKITPTAFVPLATAVGSSVDNNGMRDYVGSLSALNWLGIDGGGENRLIPTLVSSPTIPFKKSLQGMNMFDAQITGFELIRLLSLFSNLRYFCFAPDSNICYEVPDIGDGIKLNTEIWILVTWDCQMCYTLLK
jgi:hypothetical protein